MILEVVGAGAALSLLYLVGMVGEVAGGTGNGGEIGQGPFRERARNIVSKQVRRIPLDSSHHHQLKPLPEDPSIVCHPSPF